MNNTVTWFEIGTDRPAETERFYTALFGWNFADDDDTESPDGSPYRIVTTAAGASPQGGLAATGGTMPNYAIFTIMVEDTEATCRQVEAAGGKILRGPRTEGGGLTSAYLLDPAGNQFGVFTPAKTHD